MRVLSVMWWDDTNLYHSLYVNKAAPRTGTYSEGQGLYGGVPVDSLIRSLWSRWDVQRGSGVRGFYGGIWVYILIRSLWSMWVDRVGLCQVHIVHVLRQGKVHSNHWLAVVCCTYFVSRVCVFSTVDQSETFSLVC